ncbi:MAG: M23 family metallopeptidase [Patescibacteria group bacterium]
MLRNKGLLVMLAILAIMVISPSCEMLDREAENPVGPGSVTENPSQKDNQDGLQKAMVYKDPMKWPTSISDFQWPFGAYDYVRGICGVPWRLCCGYGCYLHKNTYYPGAGKYAVDFVRTTSSWTANSWVLSPARGVVVFSGWMTGYGNCVVIDHDYGHTGRGYKSIVAHLKEDPRRYVNVGNDLKAGTFLGYCWNSGGNYDYHIHFSIWQNNVSVPLAGISGDYSIYQGGIYYSGNIAVRPPANSPW